MLPRAGNHQGWNCGGIRSQRSSEGEALSSSIDHRWTQCQGQPQNTVMYVCLCVSCMCICVLQSRGSQIGLRDLLDLDSGGASMKTSTDELGPNKLFYQRITWFHATEIIILDHQWIISLSSVHHQLVISLSLVCHQPIISLSSVHHQFLSVYHQLVISLSSVYHQLVISLSSVCHQSIIS